MDLAAHALTGALIGRALAPSHTPAVEGAFTAFGAACGVAPDIDFLFELKGKVAAWRFHRVALHGVPTALALSAAIAGAAALTPLGAFGGARLFAVAAAGVLSHLGLDLLTSFGTALLYPFSRRRFTTRTHFIADPLVWAILAWAFLAHETAWGLTLLAIEIVLAALLRAAASRRARAALVGQSGTPDAGTLAPAPVLEPRALAPWQWLAVTPREGGYALARVTPLRAGAWRFTPSGRTSRAEALAQTHPLLCAFLETCDFPRFAIHEVADAVYLVVEDVKWWIWLPHRPLAFSARLGEGGAVLPPRQTRLVDRSPLGGSAIEPAPVEL